MTTLSFTPNLHRHVAAPSATVAGSTVGEALADYFRRYPQVRAYILDDQGSMHKHVAIFVNATLIRDRYELTDPVQNNDEIFVVQALSGG